MTSGNKLDKLYAKIPTFTCKEGCIDCCGPVPRCKSEEDRILFKMQQIGLACPYAVNGKCVIYEKRPFMCRLFGAVASGSLKCPHGCGPENPLSEEEAFELTREYSKIVECDGR